MAVSLCRKGSTSAGFAGGMLFEGGEDGSASCAETGELLFLSCTRLTSSAPGDAGPCKGVVLKADCRDGFMLERATNAVVDACNNG